MMKKKISIVLFLSFFYTCYSQQLAQYSLYNLNYYLINPALSGLGKNMEIQLGTRAQWLGFEGAPNTTYFSTHTPVKYPKIVSRRKQHPYHGVGTYVFRDKLGANGWNGLYLSYAFHIPFKKGRQLSFGLSSGIKQYIFNGDEIEFVQSSFDPKIAGVREVQFLPDANFGLWYHGKHFFMGTAVNQLFQNELSLDQTITGEELGNLDMHSFINIGYIYDLNRNVKLVPSSLIKVINPTLPQVDLSLKAIFNTTYFVGASLRNLDAGVLFAGINFNNWEVAYAFDLSFNKIQKNSAGSHELLVGFHIPRVNRDVLCPSDFW